MKKKVAVIFFIILSIISLCFNAYATDGTETVYVTKTGSKYHTYGCDYLNGQPLKTTLSNAIDKGYSPCKMCNPYGLADTQSSASNSDENNNYFMYMTIVLSVIVIIVLLYIVNNKLSENQKNNILNKFFNVTLIIGYIFIPLAGTILHIYTTYLLSINNGFWGAFLGFCFPIISEFYMIFNYIAKYGFINDYVCYILLYLSGLVITYLSYRALENN